MKNLIQLFNFFQLLFGGIRFFLPFEFEIILLYVRVLKMVDIFIYLNDEYLRKFLGNINATKNACPNFC